ncbi:MAG: hypothetical protein U1D55_02495 [Phycisphaerae bacterium]
MKTSSRLGRVSRRTIGATVGIGATLSSILMTGCGGPEAALLAAAGIPVPPADSFNSETLIGGSTSRLVFSQTQIPDLSNVSVDPSAYSANLSSLDPNTGVATGASSGAVLAAGPAVSDGTWIATADYEKDTLRIVNLDTGATSQILAGLVTHGLQPIALDAGRVLVTIPRGGQTVLVIHNLNTGAEAIRVENLINQYGGVALRGDILAMRVFPSIDASAPPALDALFSSNVDYVDLSSGVRKTIATVTGDAQDGFVGIGDGRIVWTESGDAATTVRVFDTHSGQTSTLAQLPNSSTPSSEYASIVGVDAAGVLVSRSTTPDAPSSTADLATTTSHQALELIDFDGQTRVLDEYDTSLSDPSYYSSPPAMVGNFAVYRNAKSGEWFVFDASTQSTRAIKPY